MRFTIIHYGVMNINSNYLVKLDDIPHIIEIPVWGVLIQTGTNNILFDLGCMENIKENWEPIQVQDTPFTPVEGGIEGQLAKIELTCQDIDIVIASHLHPDHYGLINKFPHCEVYVPEEEWVVAMKQSFGSIDNRLKPSGLYYYKCMSAPVKKFYFIKKEEDFDLCKGLRIITLPGHVNNLLGIIITVDSGKTFIFPSDAVNTPKNIEPPFYLPMNCFSQKDYIQSLRKVIEIEKQYQGTIICSHDMTSYSELKKVPDFYN